MQNPSLVQLCPRDPLECTVDVSAPGPPSADLVFALCHLHTLVLPPTPLPSSTMMARRPSGDSPTHLMLYLVARGSVSDLLLKETKTILCSGSVSSDKKRQGWLQTRSQPSPHGLVSMPLILQRVHLSHSPQRKKEWHCPWKKLGKTH